PRAGEIHVTAFEREEIEELGGWIIRRRVPVRCAIHAGTDFRPLWRRMDARQDGAASLVDPRRPVQLLDKGCGAQEFSVDAVEDVKKTVAVGLDQQALRTTV